MWQLQASIDEVGLSCWALAMATGIAASKQAVLPIWSTTTNIGGQAFAIVTT